MEKLKILLCCGAGMSSGFLASNARKYARKNHLNVQVQACSHSEAREYLGMVDVIMLGPHFSSQLDTFQKMAQPYGTKVVLIPQTVYGSLDGRELINLAAQEADRN